MTAQRFRDVLALLGWSQGMAIKLLKRDDRLIRRWYSGAMDIPQDVGDWLEMQAAHPPPPAGSRRVVTDQDHVDLT